jgi:hypothetical protein
MGANQPLPPATEPLPPANLRLKFSSSPPKIKKPSLLLRIFAFSSLSNGLNLFSSHNRYFATVSY